MEQELKDQRINHLISLFTNGLVEECLREAQKVKKIYPEEKQLLKNTNPPKFKVEFFKEQKNLENINCYSNEGDAWKKSNVNFEGYTLTIKFREAFKPRRGRINCSLNDNGKWRWFGIQFPIKEN